MRERIGTAVIRFRTTPEPISVVIESFRPSITYPGGGGASQTVVILIKTFDRDIDSASRTFDRGISGDGTFR